MALRETERVEKKNYLKLLVVIFTLLIVIVFLYIFLILPSLRDDIYREKMNHTNEMVDIGLSVLQRYHQLEQDGIISTSEAREQAGQMVRELHYGEQGQDYFWIIDFDHHVIVHPFRPDLEGANVYDFKDPEGFPLFQEFVNICKEQGGGHVSYSWQYYDEADRFEEKLSYVACFEPWEWVVGTGVYLTDLEAVIALRRNIALSLAFLFFAITSALVLFYYKSKATESELLESEEKYRLIADNTADIISILDLDMRFLYVSPAVKKIKGMEPVEAVSLNLEETMTPDSLKKFLKGYDRLVAMDSRGGADSDMAVQVEVEEYCKDGSTIWADALITLLKDENDRQIGTLVVSRNKTETKKQQEAAEKEQREKTVILENLSELVTYKDPEMNIQWANPVAEKMYQKYPEEYLDRKCYEAWYGREEPCPGCHVKKALELGRICQGIINSPEGRYWQVTASPVYDEEGQLAGVIDTALDITNLKNAEQELKKLNEELEQRVKERTAELEWINKELAAFTYSVSHDLRAPLRSIEGFSKAVLEDHGSSLDEEGRNYLQRVVSASRRMSDLIDALLKLSRVTQQELHRERVDLSAMVEAYTRHLQEKDPHRQAEVIVAPDQFATGDAALLRIALENLLDNAWKFTGSNEMIWIEFGATSRGGKTVYYISDNGIGFEVKHVTKIFNAFQRLHSFDEYPGTGIGLSIIQRIIERHGGEIWAESKPGEGSVFYFTLDC